MLSVAMFDIGVTSFCYVGWVSVYSLDSEPVITVCAGVDNDPVILTSQMFNTCFFKKFNTDIPALGLYGPAHLCFCYSMGKILSFSFKCYVLSDWWAEFCFICS